MSAPKYKLTYFDVKARAEPTRMMFAAAGVKYVDERIKRDDWPTLKSSKIFCLLGISVND